jgi:hypothetical protein
MKTYVLLCSKLAKHFPERETHRTEIVHRKGKCIYRIYISLTVLQIGKGHASCKNILGL